MAKVYLHGEKKSRFKNGIGPSESTLSAQKSRKPHYDAVRAKREERAKLKYGERNHKQWSFEELNYLQKKWGVASLGAIATRLGRTLDGVNRKAFRLGLGAPRRGTLTLREVSTRGGWTRLSILKACKAIGIEPMHAITVRQKRRGRFYSFTEEECELIFAYLSSRRSGTRHKPYVVKTRVAGTCKVCRRERKIQCKDMYTACTVAYYKKRLQWGKGQCAQHCLECGDTNFEPRTRTRCAECHRAHVRNQYAHAKAAEATAERRAA